MLLGLRLGRVGKEGVGELRVLRDRGDEVAKEVVGPLGVDGVEEGEGVREASEGFAFGGGGSLGMEFIEAGLEGAGVEAATEHGFFAVGFDGGVELG